MPVMKKAILFLPILFLFYLPFYFYQEEEALPLSTIVNQEKVALELSGYYDDNNKESILIWSAQRCRPAGFFIIERKEDSAAYHKIDELKHIQNHESISNYEYVDNSDLSSHHSICYRIAYQEKEEILEYSNPLQLSPSGSSGFKSVQLYPNPAANDFNLEFRTKMESGEVVIYDLLGMAIARKPFEGGLQKLFFDCSSWATGIYNLVIYAGDDQLQLRLSVRRMQI